MTMSLLLFESSTSSNEDNLNDTILINLTTTSSSASTNNTNTTNDNETNPNDTFNNINNGDDYGYGTIITQLPIIYTILETIVAIISIIGNLLVILVFLQDRRLRKVTNFYIISLSIADLLVGCIGIPSAILTKIGQPKNSIQLCLIMLSLLIVLCTISILNLVAVSLDRYWAILHPLDYHKRISALAIICCCWILGLLIGFLPLFGWNNYNLKQQNLNGGGGGGCYFIPIMNYNFLLFLYLVTIVLPACIMAIFYLRIYIVVVQQLSLNKVRQLMGETKFDTALYSNNFNDNSHQNHQNNLRKKFKKHSTTIHQQQESEVVSENFVEDQEHRAQVEDRNYHQKNNKFRKRACSSSLLASSQQQASHSNCCNNDAMKQSSQQQQQHSRQYRSSLPNSLIDSNHSNSSNQISNNLLNRIRLLNHNNAQAAASTASRSLIRLDHLPSSRNPDKNQKFSSSSTTSSTTSSAAAANPTAPNNDPGNHGQQQPQNNGGGGKLNYSRREVKKAQKLFVIVVFFMICWIPLYTSNAIQAICPRCPKLSETYLDYLIILSHINSAGSPFLYAFHMKDFRQALKRLIFKGAINQKKLRDLRREELFSVSGCGAGAGGPPRGPTISRDFELSKTSFHQQGFNKDNRRDSNQSRKFNHHHHGHPYQQQSHQQSKSLYYHYNHSSYHESIEKIQEQSNEDDSTTTTQNPVMVNAVITAAAVANQQEPEQQETQQQAISTSSVQQREIATTETGIGKPTIKFLEPTQARIYSQKSPNKFFTIPMRNKQLQQQHPHQQSKIKSIRK